MPDTIEEFWLVYAWDNYMRKVAVKYDLESEAAAEQWIKETFTDKHRKPHGQTYHTLQYPPGRLFPALKEHGIAPMNLDKRSPAR